MNQTLPDGQIIFRCDFCTMTWDEDRPMVEGHRGALICSQCLSIAFMELVYLDSGYTPGPRETCRLCLETQREGLHWQSPVDGSVIACKRCVKQSAGVLHKDPDNAWKKPANPRNGG